jgi:hypothetical protein
MAAISAAVLPCGGGGVRGVRPAAGY